MKSPAALFSLNKHLYETFADVARHRKIGTCIPDSVTRQIETAGKSFSSLLKTLLEEGIVLEVSITVKRPPLGFGYSQEEIQKLIWEKLGAIKDPATGKTSIRHNAGDPLPTLATRTL